MRVVRVRGVRLAARAPKSRKGLHGGSVVFYFVGMEVLSANDFWTARIVFERGLALLYVVAFVSALFQFPALLGERGFLPVPDFLRNRNFRRLPSIFHYKYSDRFFRLVALAGIGISLALLFGAGANGPPGVGLVLWLVAWFLYLSVVNVGQRFYSFGWESMLLEAGFFAAFLAPAGMAPSLLLSLLLCWMLFRVEVGAGLIKLRVGGPWKDWTALYYHHETQPMPNPLSRRFHHLPKVLLRWGVGLSHFVQVLVPFAIFLPQPVAGAAAVLIILHQGLLILAGNYAWLNFLTVCIALIAVPGPWLAALGAPPEPADLAARPLWWDGMTAAVFAGTLALSVKPALNLCSKNQLMNYCFNGWHLVNAYGAFGSMTRERYEIVVEGTRALDPDDPAAEWRPYSFKGKPGDLARVPPQIAPYHLRLDWLMWFLPLGVRVLPRNSIAVPGYEPWFLRFVQKLLLGDRQTLALLRGDPFEGEPPRFVRARFFRYQFTTRGEMRETGNVWKRQYVDDYLPAVNLKSLHFA